MDDRPLTPPPAMTSRLFPLSLCLLVPTSLVGQVSSQMNNALDWLVSHRNPDGSWGTGEAVEIHRDTTAAATALGKYRPSVELADSLDFLGDVSTQTLEGIIARGRLTLLAGSTSDAINFSPDAFSFLLYNLRSETDPSGFNAPEGGWGLAEGYQSTTYDTLLALDLLGDLTHPGLRLKSETAPPSTTLTYRVAIPTEGTASNFTVSTTGSAVQLQFSNTGPPTASDPTYTINPGITNSLPADSFTRREAWISVRSTSTTTAAVFTLSLRFDSPVQSGAAFFEGLDYLLAAQNTDGGWGLQVGDDSSPYLTARVLTLFDHLRDHFRAPVAAANGAAYLVAQANPDGGFGSDGSDVATTAFAYHALSAFASLSPARTSARSYLLAQQAPGGSWNDDPYATAVAVSALEQEFRSSDSDSDGVPDLFDNCPAIANPTQADADLDGIGDGCETDSDDDGIDNATEVTLGTDPLDPESVIAGVLDGDLDLSLDGRSVREALDAGLDPLVPRPELFAGVNFFTYPVEPTAGFSAFDLLTQLGGSTHVSQVQKYDTTSGQYLSARYTGASPTGSDFPVAGGDGLVVTMRSDREIAFAGAVSYRTPDLRPGPNLVRFPDLIPGESIFDLFTRITENSGGVVSIQRMDPATGRLTTYSSRLGSPVMPRFDVRASETYLVHMEWVYPRFVITYPANGQTVTQSPITVTGEVGPEVTSVVVAGIAASVSNGQFSAPGVTLVDGANTLDAIAIAGPEARSTLSVTVLLGEETDYTLTAGGPAVNDSATVTADPALISQVASYTVQVSGAPPGLSLITTSATFQGNNAVVFNYSISASGTVTPGIHEITLTYQLLDSGDAVLSPVSGNVLPLSILVNP